MNTIQKFATVCVLSGLVTAGCSNNGSSTPDMKQNPDGGFVGGAGGSTVQFTASGEVLALGGYTFPPANADDPAFVDGWEIRVEELLVTFDNITLSESPDKSPTDQSQTDGPVAKITGPFAADLHRGGPFMGKGGSDEQAVPVATLSNQNLNNNQPFDPTKRYAFGFDLVTASAGGTNINLDAQGRADYDLMIQNKWTVLYVGTATFKGTNCVSTNPAYDFTQLPKVVKFRLGFSSPTTYVNCQNPDNDPADPFGNEEHQRGIQIKSNATTFAQATVHIDHPFWESAKHDSPAHFDQYAAFAKKDANGEYVVTLNDLKGVNFTAFKDAGGQQLPWRSCLATYTPPNTSNAMNFDTQGIPYSPNGDPTKTLNDYVAYATYSQSTQGHLNSDGLCFVDRHYPSPQ
jgi:hypothetical protein